MLNMSALRAHLDATTLVVVVAVVVVVVMVVVEVVVVVVIVVIVVVVVVDCKTVIFFANMGNSQYSNERSGASIKMGRENRERLKNTTVRHAYIKCTKNYTFF